MQSSRNLKLAETETLIQKKYANKLLSSLSCLRAWNVICDFTIQVDDESFPVHSAVLAAASKYFLTLIKNKDPRVKNKVYVAADMAPHVVKECIEFMYSGEACITWDNVQPILIASESFEIDDLTELCLEFVSANLSVENCISVKNLHEKRNRKEKIAKFLSEHFEKLILTSGFLNLSKSNVEFYLKTDNLKYELIWQALKNWINFCPMERKPHYLELISLNSDSFPASFALDTIWPDPLTIESQQTMGLIGNALLNNLDTFRDGLTCKNCFHAKQVCEIVKHSNCNEAHGLVRLFMMKHFEELCDRDEILSLSKDEIFQIFRSPKAKFSSETIKWKVALHWVKHDLLSRKQYFPQLLASIRLENMPLDFLQDVVRTEDMVQQFDECKEILMDAFYTIANPTSSSTTQTPRGKGDSPKTPRSSVRKGNVRSVAKEPVASSVKRKRLSTEFTSSPAKKLRKQTNATITDESLPEHSSAIANPCIAVFNPNTGKVKGLNLKSVQWSEIASTKVVKGLYQGIVCIANTIYLLKGLDLFSLNIAKKSWNKLPSKQKKPLTCTQLVSWKGFIYVLQDGHYDVFNTIKENWVEEQPFMNQGAGFCSCVLLNSIYAMGGENDPMNAGKYDILTKSVSKIEKLTTGRVYAAATTLKGKVYVLGGAVKQRLGMLGSSAECYDSVTDSWTNVAVMQVERSHLAACTCNGKIYAVGGALPSDGTMDTVEVFEHSQKDKCKWRIFHRMLRMGNYLSACMVDIPSV